MIQEHVLVGQWPSNASVDLDTHELLHWLILCVILGDIVYVSTLYTLMTF